MSGFMELIFTNNWQLCKVYLFHQTDHLMAFASSQDIKLKFLPCIIHFYIYHLIRFLEGKETSSIVMFLQRQKHKFKEVT